MNGRNKSNGRRLFRVRKDMEGETSGKNQAEQPIDKAIGNANEGLTSTDLSSWNTSGKEETLSQKITNNTPIWLTLLIIRFKSAIAFGALGIIQFFSKAVPVFFKYLTYNFKQGFEEGKKASQGNALDLKKMVLPEPYKAEPKKEKVIQKDDTKNAR